MKLKSILGIVAVATLGVTINTGTAYAASSYCVAGPNSDGLSLGDVTFRGNAADDCYGVALDNITANGNGGNDGPTEITSYFSGGAYGTGTFVGFDSNGASQAVGGTTFTLTDTGAQATGTWTLTATGGLPNTFDIAFALKGSDRYAAYFFDDELFTAPQSGVGQLGTWTITFVNNGGQIPTAADIVGFVREGTPGGSGTAGGQTVVPEPASLLLLGSGLLAVARASRKKKAQHAE